MQPYIIPKEISLMQPYIIPKEISLMQPYIIPKEISLMITVYYTKRDITDDNRILYQKRYH